jgi:hypothetical protein
MEIPRPRSDTGSDPGSDPGSDLGADTGSDTGSGRVGPPDSTALGALGDDKVRGAAEPRRTRSSSAVSLRIGVEDDDGDPDGDQAGDEDEDGDDSSELADAEDDADDDPAPDDDGGQDRRSRRDNDLADRRRATEQRGPGGDILGDVGATAGRGEQARSGAKALLVGFILVSIGMLLLEQPLLEALTRSPHAGAPARWLVLALQHPFRCPLALLLLALALRASPLPPPRRAGPEGGAGL